MIAYLIEGLMFISFALGLFFFLIGSYRDWETQHPS